MVQHDIRAFLLGPKTKKVHHELLVATYLLGPLFTEIAKTLQSRSLDFQGYLILFLNLGDVKWRYIVNLTKKTGRRNEI